MSKNVISKNPSMLYLLMGEDQIPYQLSTYVDLAFVLFPLGFELFSQDRISWISRGAFGILAAKEDVCKVSNISSILGTPSNIANYMSSSSSRKVI